MINILLLHNKYTAEIFTARLAQSNLIPKTDFDTILISLNNKQTQIKQNINFLKMNFKNYKHLIQFILKAKVILKKMVLKIIQYFSQYTYILKGFQVLVVVIIFIFGNLKDCLMKILQLLLQLIIVSIHS